jgi:hypothetical protein
MQYTQANTGLFISPSGISDPCGTVAGMVTPNGSMSTEGETLPLLTCSPSAWPSRLLYRRGQKSRRDLWITLYIIRCNYIVYFHFPTVLGTVFYKDKEEFLQSLKFPLIPYLFIIFLDWLALMCVILRHSAEVNCVITGGKTNYQFSSQE